MIRLFDILVSLFCLLALSPLILVASCAIKSESRGPILFIQSRVGKHGVSFKIFKLRTMLVDAEVVGPRYTMADDPRVTRVGAWLRRTSLDEIPQLANVLLGQMSLVGPRPATPDQVSLYPSEAWTLRTSVKPGITGLAQARLRSDGSLNNQIKYDSFFVRRASSVGFYFKILVWTACIVFSRRGVN